MEFEPWPKTARLFREVVVTEKLDGTNACVIIDPNGSDEVNHVALAGYQHTEEGETWFQLGAQSRKRFVTPEKDNFGFARWVRDNAETLVRDLGPGRHYGEWWGQGIQRGYGLDHKRFSLFNVAKWAPVADDWTTPDMYVVPQLSVEGAEPEETLEYVKYLAACLRTTGSIGAPGFMNPEGICIFHTQSRQVYKYTLDGDGHKDG